MKKRLIVGTINWYHAKRGWMNYHLDISPRAIWDPEIRMGVLPQFVGSIADLTEFRDETFDEVRAHHVLEHLTRDDVIDAAAGVYRILKVGGVFDIEVPDVERVAAAIVSGELTPDGYNQWLHGETLANHEPGDTHRSAWSEETLLELLVNADFDIGAREETGLALRFIAKKGS